MNALRDRRILSVLTVLLFVSCAPTIYQSASLDKSRSTMKVIAILPFSVSIDSKRLPKGTTIETLKESEMKTGYEMQSGAYTWFLQRSNSYTVTFQDIDKTNALLKKANISYEVLTSQDKGELCKMLGVNGVISGTANFSKPMSEGGAIAMTVMVGYGGSTNKMNASLTIHDDGGNLLWKYDHEMDGGLGSSASTVATRLLKNSSRHFPYKSN